MTLEFVVYQWLKAEGAAIRMAVGSIVGLLLVIGAVICFVKEFVVAAAIILVLGLFLIALSRTDFDMRTHRDEVVPDALLERIADADMLPQFKSELAQSLQSEGKVTFCILRKLYGEAQEAHETAQARKGAGYQKLVQRLEQQAHA